MALFERDTVIYTNREALREDYQPDELVGRDEEIQKYQAALRPAINGEQPDNVFVYGKTGVGKTTATRHLLSDLQKDAKESDGIELHLTFLNCDGLTSSYQIATHLVNEFRSNANQISTTGYSRATVYEMLWDELDKRGGTHLIVLDEVNHVEDDSILYQLPRAQVNDNLSDAQIGVIGISDDLSFRDNLSSKVKRTLCEQEIHFSGYDIDVLQKILEQRAEVAFRDGVLDHTVVPLCAAHGTKDAGDVSQSIDILRKAGDLAREEDTKTVTERHVKNGHQKLKYSRIEDRISSLTQHGHIVLYAVLTLHFEDEAPIRSRDVWSRYTTLTQRAGPDPLVPRRMRDQLAELAMHGLISTTDRNEGRRGGVYREYSLNVDTEPVLSALEETVVGFRTDFSKRRYMSDNNPDTGVILGSLIQIM